MSLLPAIQDAIRRSPADETEIRVRDQHNALTRFGDGAITQNVSQHSEQVTVRVRHQEQEATAQVNRLDHIDQAVSLALKAATCQSPGQPPPLIREQLPVPAAIAYDQATADLSPEARAQGARQALALCAAQGARAAGSYSVRSGRAAYANSHGVAHEAPTSFARFGVTADQDGGSGWAAQAAVRAADLGLAAVTKRALDKCLMSRSPRPLAPGTYQVLLEPAAVADLLYYLNVLSFNALRYLDGRHFAAGRLGEHFFDARLTVRDDVVLTGGIPFDEEGVPRQPVSLIERGRLVGLVHDRRTAERLGVASTGHGLGQPNTTGPLAQNLVLEAGIRPLDQLLAGMERGVLVTQLHYLNVVDPMNLSLTGLTRNGTFWVERGQIQYPIENLRFTDSLLSCLAEAEPSLERELTSAFWGAWMLTPGLLLERFHFSSSAGF